MPGPLNPPRNLGSIQARNLGNPLSQLLGRYAGLNPANQQKGFNYAMEVLHRPNTNTNQKLLARFMLRYLARTYGRTWTTHPSSSYFNMNNYNSNRNNKTNLRAKANTPVTRNWTFLKNKADPISLLNNKNWNGNKAIEVNQNGRTTYFTLGSFNGYFGNRWKTMPLNSNNSIHDTKTHPLTRQPIMRKNVRLVKFIGNKNKASEP